MTKYLIICTCEKLKNSQNKSNLKSFFLKIVLIDLKNENTLVIRSKVIRSCSSKHEQLQEVSDPSTHFSPSFHFLLYQLFPSFQYPLSYVSHTIILDLQSLSLSLSLKFHKSAMSSSEREMSFVLPSSLEEIIRTRYPNLSPFLPFLLGFAVPAPSQDHQESGEMGTVRERIVLINPSSELVIVIEGSGNLESLFRDLSNKVGPSPASKASIEAMPAVKITEEGSECAICLGEYEIGGNAKEMPCKHRYHSGCVEKWLRIHGSCPVCRYKMPVEEDESGKRSDGDEEGRRRRVEGEIRVSLFVRRGSGLGSASESDNSSSDSSRRDDAVAEDGSSTQ